MISLDERSGVASQNISLEQKVAFLKDKENYSQPTSNVEAVKTHMSWIFLTDQFVYKLKIPDRYDHLSLKTSKARLRNCVEELRLNKRLAGEVYIGVVPLSVGIDGKLILGRGKWPVDWLVKMKRLPADSMLDYWIKTGKKFSESKLKPVAELLVRFYISAEPVLLSLEEYQKKLLNALNKYRKELLSTEFKLPEQIINSIFLRQVAFITKNPTILESRIRDKKIIEAHGDLKPEHICLSPPAIIDCLEFDRDLRIMDIFDDLAFLSLECDRLGASRMGEYFIDYYIRETNDRPEDGIIGFYKSFKAFTRALLSIRHIREEQYKGDPKWKKRTLLYLDLADEYI